LKEEKKLGISLTRENSSQVYKSHAKVEDWIHAGWTSNMVLRLYFKGQRWSSKYTVKEWKRLLWTKKVILFHINAIQWNTIQDVTTSLDNLFEKLKHERNTPLVWCTLSAGVFDLHIKFIIKCRNTIIIRDLTNINIRLSEMADIVKWSIGRTSNWCKKPLLN